MTASEIRKYSHLSELELVEIKLLYDACTEHDHIPPRMYWDAVSRRDSKQYRDFIYFHGSQVIGYLGFFVFADHEIEICAFVDPAFRNQNIFRQLLFYASHEIEQMQAQKVSFTVPHSTKLIPAIHWLNKLGAELAYTEYRMDLDKPFPQEVVMHEITIHDATTEDITDLAILDHECFGADLETMIGRYQAVLLEPTRHAWVAKFQGKTIGKVHAHVEEDIAFIHDFCILPSYQGKHHGLALLQYAVNYLLANAHPNISVYVQAANERALKLYQYANFNITEAWDTWAWNPRFQDLEEKEEKSNLH